LRIRRTMALAATAALIAACGTADDDQAAQPDDQLEQPDAEGEDPFGDQPELTDPNEQVADGSYRGEGIVLPVPDGWRLDEMAFAQGLVLAMPDDGSQQFFGQAVDTDDLPEEIDFDELVAANRDQFEVGPTEDEEIELEGAAQAHLLRFDELPAQQEGEPDGTLVLVIADDGDGQIAVFNYAAPSDDFDDDHADLLLRAAGFDPDSDPSPPAPMGEPAPAPEG
jgi:hypothetical protein